MKTPEYRQRLDEHTRPGTLWRPGAAPGSVVCVACPQRCRLEEGRRGACGLRFCHDGVLQVPWGYTSSVAVDPLEKKPFFHVCPGAGVLSFGTLGCTLRDLGDAGACRLEQGGVGDEADRLPPATGRGERAPRGLGGDRRVLDPGAAAGQAVGDRSDGDRRVGLRGLGEGEGPQAEDESLTEQSAAGEDADIGGQDRSERLQPDGGVVVERSGARGIPTEVAQGAGVGEGEHGGGHRRRHRNATSPPS